MKLSLMRSPFVFPSPIGWMVPIIVLVGSIAPAIAAGDEDAASQSPGTPAKLTRAQKTTLRQTIEALQAKQMPQRDSAVNWPQDRENAFWERGYGYFERFHQAIAVQTRNDTEKRTYAELMAAAIAGDAQNQRLALERLQTEDAQTNPDHTHTRGIDYYWCFTLKQQMRKYFLLGDRLNPTYRDRMKDGARRWTASDPLPRFELIHNLGSPEQTTRNYALTLLQKLTRQPLGLDMKQWLDWWHPWTLKPWQELEEEERKLNILPHPFYQRGKGGIGIKEQWGPEVRGSWVDGRNTTNLRLMRDTSIYLMAEETGNEKTRLLYKDKLRFFVWQLYQVGMGEWDSENYLPHSLTPLLNLYDFAKDREVHQLAKAGLDWLLMSGALKYYRGGFGGPTLRDFGGASHVFGSSASHPLYLYFGDALLSDPNPRYDDIHVLTSRYRPPLAVVQLAQKAFQRPVELLNTKPDFDVWKAGQDNAPSYYETLFYGNSFTLGSVVSQGENAGHPFKLLLDNRQRGVDYLLAHSKQRFHRPDPTVQIGQYRNLMIWLRPNDGKPTFFQLPLKTQPIITPTTWFMPFDKTYVALRPIGLKSLQAIASAKTPRSNQYHQDWIWQAAPDSKSPYIGFALEVVDGQHYPNFRAFQTAIQTKQTLDLSQWNTGRISLRGTNHQTLSMTYHKVSQLPTIVRGGKERDWAKEWAVYGSPSAATTNLPVRQDWKNGRLQIQSNQQTFQQTVTRTGTVTTSVTRRPEPSEVPGAF
jgi:hypothetical protein